MASSAAPALSHSAKGERLTLPTVDGFPTQAILYHPADPDAGKPALVLAAATGVPGNRFFVPFATWLASLGYPVITFDYRYIGLSFPPGVDVRDADARIEALKSAPEVNISLHWTRDAGAAIRLLHSRYCEGGRELAYIGNSHGAHVLVLAVRERDLVDRAMSVSTFSPFHFSFEEGEEREWGMGVVLAISRQEGYFVATVMGRGMDEQEQQRRKDKQADADAADGAVGSDAAKAGVGYDLTLGAGEEWVRWCGLPRYMATEHAHAFTSFCPRQPYVSVGWTDDAFTKGDPLAYDQMLYTLPMARTHRLIIDPQKMGPGWKAGCRHVDAFREAQREGAWQMLRKWVETGVEPDGAGVNRAEFGGTFADRQRDRGVLGAARSKL